jgi:hypothetical protein
VRGVRIFAHRSIARPVRIDTVVPDQRRRAIGGDRRSFHTDVRAYLRTRRDAPLFAPDDTVGVELAGGGVVIHLSTSRVVVQVVVRLCVSVKH